jgi:hypothetical protein
MRRLAATQAHHRIGFAWNGCWNPDRRGGGFGGVPFPSESGGESLNHLSLVVDDGIRGKALLQRRWVVCILGGEIDFDRPGRLNGHLGSPRCYGLTDWGQALCPALDAILKWAASRDDLQGWTN